MSDKEALANLDQQDEVHQLRLYGSQDSIQVNRAGVLALYGVAIVALVGCLIAIMLNWVSGTVNGNAGAWAGFFVSLIILYFLNQKEIQNALIAILWGFALIPIFFGVWRFGFSAPGLVCVPISIMASSWALPIRHTIAMTISAVVAGMVFYFLVAHAYIQPTEPNLSVRALMFICITLVALLLGTVGMRALRLEFARVRDIARVLKEKVQDLERSEASFSKLFLSNPLPAISGDMQGRLLEANQAFLTMFGYSRAELIGQSLNNLKLFEGDLEEKPIAIDSLSQSVVGKPVSLRLPTGDLRHFLLSTSVFESPHGWRFVALFLDQTDRLAAERAQYVLNVELEKRVKERTVELTEALDNLKCTQQELVQSEKLASLGSMVAGVAHELNTPVGNALMVATTITDQQHEFEQSLDHGLSRSALNHFLSTIRDSSDILDRNLRRTADLINSFKQVAVDQTSEQRRVFDLRDLVHEVMVTISPSLRKTTHSLQADIPEGLVFDSFPGPLEQVLMNLTTNALRHAFDGREGGRIQISAERLDQGWVRLHFRDDGQGIPAANLPRVFDPFFTTKLGQGGSGLGLSIAYNIVTGMLGGRIEVRSELGKGTEFCMDVPLQAQTESVNSAASVTVKNDWRQGTSVSPS